MGWGNFNVQGWLLNLANQQWRQQQRIQLNLKFRWTMNNVLVYLLQYLGPISDRMFSFKPMCTPCSEPLNLGYEDTATLERERYNIKIGKCVHVICIASWIFTDKHLCNHHPDYLLLKVWLVDQEHGRHLGAKSQAPPLTYWMGTCSLTWSPGDLCKH